MATLSSSTSIQDTKEKQPLKLGASLVTLVDLELDFEKTALMENSVFYNLLQIKYRRESSASLISLFCKVYDPDKKSFVFNNDVSFSFCAEEVAEVLGIKNTGTSLVYTPAKRFPEFLFELKEKFDPDGSRQIKSKSIKIFLEKMSIDDEQSKSNFKQLLSYFLIEQLLLCSPDAKKPRVSSWGKVEDMNAFEEVNWAKIIYDNICESFGKLKAAMDRVHKQLSFNGCAPVFEAIVFKRIKPLNPGANPGFAYLPIESYKAKRKDWKPLEMLKASEITPCSYCGDGGEGDASPSPSSSIPANVAENFLASGAESDSASSLKGVHDCSAEDSLASSFVDICIDDAQPSVPVNDAQPSVPPPLLRRSSRTRKEVVKYSPSFLKKK